MMDLLMVNLPYYKLKNNHVIKIKRNYMYRVGPTSFFLAFGTNLGNPNMSFIYSASIYLSRKDVKKNMRLDEDLLNNYINKARTNKTIKDITQKLSETIVSEMALLKDKTMRYPVMVIGLEEKIKQETIDYFEMIGYNHLKL